jgi:hypothetical protein
MQDEKKFWPSWRYGPSGQSQIFDHENQVPEGWVDHPGKLPEEDGSSGGPASHPPADRRNSVAADHTRGGNENINRGTPETHETDGGTTGGELGQTVDNTNLFSLPPVDEVDKTWIIAQLNTRKIVHNPRWKLQKLYDLLHDAVAPAHQG